jgi:hypothetical protein
MRIVIILIAVAVPARAQWKTVEPVEIKGAYGLIIVPENWNGSLFIYAHGYSADQRLITPFPADLTIGNFLGTVNMLFQATLIPTLSGYASATTTFRTPGWNVKDSIKDIENLRRYFAKKYGKPKRTYLWGHSGGGMVTSTIIEYLPNTYDGALPMCGPGAGARRNFDGALDLRLTNTCAGVRTLGSRVASARTAPAAASRTATAPGAGVVARSSPTVPPKTA